MAKKKFDHKYKRNAQRDKLDAILKEVAKELGFVVDGRTLGRESHLHRHFVPVDGTKGNAFVMRISTEGHLMGDNLPPKAVRQLLAKKLDAAKLAA